MPTEAQVREKLEEVIVPGVMCSLARLNLICQIAISDVRVNVTLASTALNSEIQEWLKNKISEVIGKLSDVKEVQTDFIEMKIPDINEIGSVIAIMSGKGGVGKSLVTGLTGLSLARQGYDVGILDADITGPSIPKMFGISSRPVGSETGIMPVLSKAGIEIMSINLLLPNEDDAVIWRGPLIGNTIKQFWEEVVWGKLDYLIVDLPPGTADASLTVMQTLPLSGVIIVFSPQELAAMVVRKTVQMSQKMNIPILGVVENMSYFTLPDTGKKIELFGKSRAEEMVKSAGAPLLAQIPIDPALAQHCDDGNIESYDSEIVQGYADKLSQVLKPK
ncbi:Mrp/NBP35 family ATP-binding protein [Chloroflexota bacterium]